MCNVVDFSNKLLTYDINSRTIMYKWHMTEMTA